MPPFLMLFVPANRPSRFSKAAASRADAIIIDLEDAVGAAEKPAARDALRAALLEGNLKGQVFVRMNPADSPDYASDVAALRGLPVQGIMLAKAENVDDIAALQRIFAPPLGVTALIETARGLVNARDLAQAADRLAFGSIDYAHAVGMAHGRDALLAARSELVLASALAGGNAPLDGVTATITAPEITTEDAAYSKSLGFGGKLLIHPAQVVPALKGWLPDVQALDAAQRLLAQTGGNAAMVDGQMVDLPVIAAAQRLVSQAEAIAARLTDLDLHRFA
jgi:citrate lyase subunit beta/citryl-CoA lyase